MHRILVVDDDPSIGKALAMGLSSADYEVDVAVDGASGILLGSRKGYDVLIADLCLPDMDGLQVIERIRQMNPGIVPIMITGIGSIQSCIEAIRIKASDYLEKPFTLESVKNSIETGLEKQASKRNPIGGVSRDTENPS